MQDKSVLLIKQAVNSGFTGGYWTSFPPVLFFFLQGFTGINEREGLC